MPSMAAIVVKKFDDLTNVTYDVLTPASGDAGAAYWRQDTGAVAAVPVGHRAIVWLKSAFNGPKTARRTTGEYRRPFSVLNTTTGRYEVTDTVIVKLEVVAPQGMPASELNEGVYQGLNFFQSALVRQSAASGFAPS